jgi:uncharacterized protein YndB with AHSA1/START domain
MVPTELTITRIINVPREKVFKAFTDEKLIAEWWGPKYMTSPDAQLDARVGGEMKVDMHDPQGIVYPCRGEYKEIDEPSKLVFVLNAIDKDGSFGIENLNTVTLEDMNGKTRLTLHVEVLRHKPEFEKNLGGMEMGWNQSLDKLADSFIT